jgi:transcriptional regulator with XRE-family HTH domain
MYERIEKLRKNKGLTVRKVEEDNGFSNGSLKKISPKTECGRILSLSKYFGVSMEYLITGKTGSGTSLTFEDKAILDAYHSVSDEKKEIICDILHIKKDLLLSKEA